MSILSDRQITELCQTKGMITPYVTNQVRVNEEGEKIISWGVSSFGYDVRCQPEFKLFTNIHSPILDPKNFDERCFVTVQGDSCIIPPNGFVLTSTIEVFNIPRDIMVVCVGKSTLARLGLIVNVTPVEPGFKGAIVIEVSNTTNIPARLYAKEGIAQFLFFQGSEECTTSYADRLGKYQLQSGIVTARV